MLEEAPEVTRQVGVLLASAAAAEPLEGTARPESNTMAAEAISKRNNDPESEGYAHLQ